MNLLSFRYLRTGSMRSQAWPSKPSKFGRFCRPARDCVTAASLYQVSTRIIRASMVICDAVHTRVKPRISFFPHLYGCKNPKSLLLSDPVHILIRRLGRAVLLLAHVRNGVRHAFSRDTYLRDIGMAVVITPK